MATIAEVQHQEQPKKLHIRQRFFSLPMLLSPKEVLQDPLGDDMILMMKIWIMEMRRFGSFPDYVPGLPFLFSFRQGLKMWNSKHNKLLLSP